MFKNLRKVLFKDLPPLKFWSSPAAVIESYLLRKVFQKRLQLAYEFNQSKDPTSSDTEASADEAQTQLTQALIQLTSDMNYFQHLASQQVLKQAQQREIETEHKSYKFQNKAIWERISPEKEGVIDDDSLTQVPEVEIPHHERLSRDITNRYIKYKDFYKLKNIPQTDKKSLAQSIQQTQQKSLSTSDDSAKFLSVCFNDVDSITKWNEIKKSPTAKRVTLTNVSGRTNNKSNQFDSILSLGTVPQVKYSSIDSYNRKIDKQKIISNESALQREMQGNERLMSQLFTNSMVFDSFNRKGTLLSMRDSFELNQKRVSSFSKTSLVRKNKSKPSSLSFLSHRDSYMMLVRKRLDKPKSDTHSPQSNLSKYNNDPNKIRKSSSLSEELALSLLTEHRDSIELASDKKLLKKLSKSNKTVTCDICYNDCNKPVQFTCNLHSEMCSLQPTPKHHFSIISSKKTYFRHKDSLEVIPKTLSNKEKNKSVQIQAPDINRETLPTTIPDESPLQLVSAVKGSQKSKKMDKPIVQADINVTPSKLNLYLMKSMNVNQIVMDDNNKPSV